MSKNELVVNQTLLIWSAVVIVEIFIIAHLLMFPILILAALTMYWPIKAALNWPRPLEKKNTQQLSADASAER